jgi:signal transduction histidine kinase
LIIGEVDTSEFRIVTKSGETRWLMDHGYPVWDDTENRVTFIYGAAQDITNRKRYEQELQERNEELDAFSYTVAHDLKNPIASMMGFASLILTYFDRMPPEQIKEYVELVLEGGYQLKSIINALLLLAGVNKMEAPQMELLDMQVIAEQAQRRLSDMTQRSHAQILYPDNWQSAQGYAPWVEEIWANYLSNAIKYGGEPPIIHLGSEQLDNGMCRFYVRDNGRGLTEEEQARVFTPFTRLNQVKIEGHGLGLSVVHRIVAKLGGEISVTSTPNEGSEFSFTLPAYTPK